MSEVLNALFRRRSIRQYTGEQIPHEKLDIILSAALVSESARNQKAFELILVRNRNLLQQMSQYRGTRKNQLADADAAIVVIGDPTSDTWIEDCVIALANMHLVADSIGIGSCIMQGRLRSDKNGRSADDYLRALLGYPAHRVLQGILCMGIPAEHPAPHTQEELPLQKVHFETY